MLSVGADLAAQRYYLGEYAGLVDALQRLYTATANPKSEFFDTHIEVGHLRVLTFLALGDFAAAAIAGNEIRSAIVSVNGEHNYGAMLLSAKRFDAATEQLRKAQTIWESHDGANHPNALACRELLAEVALAQGQSSSARQDLVAIIELQRQRPDAFLARSLWALATLDTNAGDNAAATRDLNQARALLFDLGADDSALAQRIRHANGQSNSGTEVATHTLDPLLDQAHAIIAAAPQR